jgi:hypothetical protein
MMAAANMNPPCMILPGLGDEMGGLMSAVTLALFARENRKGRG